MKSNYADIRARIDEEPTWWDENGCPRYGKFHPNLSPNIYAHEVMLLEIACQECGRRFLVEMSTRPWFDTSFRAQITACQERRARGDNHLGTPVHYGDPPRHDGDKCAAGHTMNCYDLRIVEFWVKKRRDWMRCPEFEVELEEYPE